MVFQREETFLWFGLVIPTVLLIQKTDWMMMNDQEERENRDPGSGKLLSVLSVAMPWLNSCSLSKCTAYILTGNVHNID